MNFLKFTSESVVSEQKEYIISFEYSYKKMEFRSPIFRKVYTDVIYWLYMNGYKFDESAVQRRLFKKSEVPQQYIGKGLIYDLPNTDLCIIVNLGNDQSIRYLKIMLERFGVDVDTFIFSHSINITKSVQKSKNKNPFQQSICIIGESGAGKSVTIRNILSHEGHKFDFIIPSALSGGLLVQYSPADSEYKLSKLGNMIVDAYRDPSNNYTMVIDEMHKSHVIEMINDELLQAISTKRNKYRFVSLDPEATDLFVNELGRDILKAGNVRIPDNFGILFISSKDKVIINNEDFFNRVDLVFLDESDRSMKTARDLENKVLSNEEKKSLREN